MSLMNYALVKNVIKLLNWIFTKVMMKNAAIHIILAHLLNVELFITISLAKKDGKNLKAIMKILKNDIESNLKIVTILMTGSRQIAYNVYIAELKMKYNEL